MRLMKHDNKKDELTNLAKRIRNARENAHLSQQALGKGIGVSDKSISAFEKGRSQPPLLRGRSRWLASARLGSGSRRSSAP